MPSSTRSNCMNCCRRRPSGRCEAARVCAEVSAMSSNRFRRVALGLPEVIEGAHQGHADFRVGKRIFATLGYPDDGWGKHGNTNVRLARADQARLLSALTLAWTNIAPKLLLATRKKTKP